MIAILHPWRAAMCAGMLALVLVVQGCYLFVSRNDLMRSWIGTPVEEITSLWGQPNRVETRGDGMTVYIYDRKKLDPSCVLYWIVNKEKVVVDVYYEGHCGRPF